MREKTKCQIEFLRKKHSILTVQDSVQTLRKTVQDMSSTGNLYNNFPSRNCTMRAQRVTWQSKQAS